MADHSDRPRSEASHNAVSSPVALLCRDCASAKGLRLPESNGRVGARWPKRCLCVTGDRKDTTMHSPKAYLSVLVLVMGGVLAGCQQTPPSPTTVVVPGDTPAPQTSKTESTSTHTETKQSTPATVNPDGTTTPATESSTTQRSTTVEQKQQ